jgi:hypothetical protein
MDKTSIRGGPQTFTRTLIYFPIIHTQTDMGGLSESLRRATIRKLGQKGWKLQVNAIEKMWTGIERTIDSLALPYERVRLYQDGLAVCRRELQIVKELAEAGSRNHRLLLRLMEKGATVMGTESSELLLEEYELVKQVLTETESGEAAEAESRLKALSDSLLKRRDEYIADRINGTLQTGETGILFLGMLHSVEHKLDSNIRVIYPMNKPLGRGGKGDGRNRRTGSDC